MADGFAVRLTAGSLLHHEPAYVVPHSWTDAGVAVEGGGTGAHLLHASVALCVLNDLYREADRDGMAVEGVAVTAGGGFAADWTSTGIGYAVEVDTTEDEALVAGLLERVDEVAEVPRAVRAEWRCGAMANRHTSKQVRSRYGRYAGGDPLAQARRHRRGAGRHRPGRDGGLLARARDAGVPASRRPRPERPRRPRAPGRRAAPRAAPEAQPRRHHGAGPRAARQGGARGAQAAGPRRGDGRRRPRAARDAARRGCRPTSPPR